MPIPGRIHGLAALAIACLALPGFVVSGCGDGDDAPTATATASALATTTATGSRLEGEILVFAAASLADVFNAMADAFTDANPGVTVTFNFAASSALSTQINEGAPADVFASADNAQMKIVTDAGNASNPRVFATNSPVVVKPAGSDAVADFAGLADPGLRLVLAGPDVPIGRYSREILAKASAGSLGADFSGRVLANLQSDEANVRAVLTKVQLGEADAGIVYSTDAAIGGDEVESIEIPPEYNVIAQYPIAVVSDSGNLEAAEAWVAFVLSDEGQAILEEFGFGPPP
jgi:molybdate transport system substrate-binding protein